MAANQKNLSEERGGTTWPELTCRFSGDEKSKKQGGGEGGHGKDEEEEERMSSYPTCFSPNMGCSCSSS